MRLKMAEHPIRHPRKMFHIILARGDKADMPAVIGAAQVTHYTFAVANCAQAQLGRGGIQNQRSAAIPPMNCLDDDFCQ